MDLRQLRYFMTVAEEHSVTRAAARLHLTQPPLTVQLSRLERELGVPLLIRHRRGVDLTDAGRYLATHARRLLAEVDALAESVRQLGEGRSGRLALAFDSATAWAPLPQLLERFRVDRPDVVLDVSEETADGVLEAVRLRRTDLGLVHLPPPTVARTRDPQLDFAVVHREPLVAVLPAALATQHGERADLAALAAQQFLAPAPGAWGGLQRHLVEACRQAGFEPNVRDVKLVPTVVALVGAGLGVSILPSSVRAVSGDKVAVLPLARHVPVVETAIVRRRDEPPAPPARHLLRLALSTPEPDMLAPELAPARTGRDAVWRWGE
jgi:DNA-binding transcriptional LysR family regulator